MTLMNRIADRLRGEINTFPVVDSHDHLGPDPDGTWPEFDLCDLLFHNLNPDLISAGMPGVGTHAQTPWPARTRDVSQKWETVRNYVFRIENMASYKGLLRGLKELYDFQYSTINDSNWEMLNEQVVAAYQRKNWLDYVLQEKCNIKAAIIDMDRLVFDRDYLLPAIKLDYIMMSGLDPQRRKNLEKKHNIKIERFDEFVDLIHSAFNFYLEGGVVAFKSVAAYYRSLFYRDVSTIRAKEIYELPFSKVTPDLEKDFQDFVMHKILSLVEESDIPIQFHTGKLAWNFQTIENTNPTHLTNLLQKFRQTRFSLFHGGLPYTNEFAIMVNNYPNAFLDINGLAWTSFSITRRCLYDWLEMIPQNKIVWGADSYRVIEGVFGQLLYFKDILSEVLAKKIYEGYFDEEAALEMARKIMYKNAIDFFSLKDKLII